MADRHALVEHEAFAAPQAFGLGHLLQIVEDAALQVEDVADPLRLQEGRRLLAADAAGAVHGHLQRRGVRAALALQAGAIVAEPVGKVREAGGLRIDRALEGADGDLVVVAGVDHHDVGIGDQGVPVGRLDIGPGVGGGSRSGRPRVTISFFSRTFMRWKGMRSAQAVLGARSAQPGRARIWASTLSMAASVAGDGAVDPLAGQQQRAPDA
jgi:hypothetical protein